MSNSKKQYNIGLDIGATSVGFSAIDNNYQPIKLPKFQE